MKNFIQWLEENNIKANLDASIVKGVQSATTGRNVAVPAAIKSSVVKAIKQSSDPMKAAAAWQQASNEMDPEVEKKMKKKMKKK